MAAGSLFHPQPASPLLAGCPTCLGQRIVDEMGQLLVFAPGDHAEVPAKNIRLVLDVKEFHPKTGQLRRAARARCSGPSFHVGGNAFTNVRDVWGAFALAAGRGAGRRGDSSIGRGRWRWRVSMSSEEAGALGYRSEMRRVSWVVDGVRRTCDFATIGA